MAITQQSLLPIRKVLAGGLSGLASWALIWGFRKWGQYELDPDNAALIVLAVTSGVGYIIPPHARDVITQVDQDMKDAGERL